MFTSVILPRPLSWALFPSQQEPISGMKPYELCKEFYCKCVLSMLDSQSYVVIWTDFSKHVLCLNMAKIYKLMSHSKKFWPSTGLKWISFFPHLTWSVSLACGPRDIIMRRTWSTEKSRTVRGKVEARPVSCLMLVTAAWAVLYLAPPLGCFPTHFTPCQKPPQPLAVSHLIRNYLQEVKQESGCHIWERLHV